MLSFAEKTRLEGNPASVHTFKGNPENCLKATVNPKIGGLIHLASGLENTRVKWDLEAVNPENF